ncbi:MAG: Mut7-C ubiquitin/RNAse domain-containing protein [Thermoflexales bacterium]|nr:Mut7-C ubiquitin/RNAse domain-containing protein [Thermoflexales bacterium]
MRIRFYAELNDFLTPKRRQVEFGVPFAAGATIKDIVESCNVPHTEVDLILVNGRSVDFEYAPQDGDRVSVYPVFESFDITPVVHLRPAPLRETKFVLDVHLGKLAGLLRLLGFDTVYCNSVTDAELARVSVEERRILLTRDRGILKRSRVTHGYYVRESNPRRQAAEVVRRFDLRGQLKPYTRCMRCNGLLQPTPKAEVLDRLEPLTKLYYNEFHQCTSCRQVYWQGSHFEALRQFVDEIANSQTASPAESTF